MSRWEVEDDDWDRVREHLRTTLLEVAQRESLISYSDLIVDVPEIDGPDSHALAEMLGEISAHSHDEGKPLLSALVVYKDKNKLGPGPGFFDAAKRLGISVGSAATARNDFWSLEVKKCHEQWSSE